MTPSALDSLLGAVSVMKPQGTNLLPLQGVLQIAIIPRAMPWAKSFWAFSPFLNHIRNLSELKNERR